MYLFTTRPAVGENFVGREEILGEMIKALTHKDIHTGFALCGKRRVGKTSILKELCRRLKGTKVVPVYFSVWDMIDKSLEGFVQELTKAIIDAYGPRLSPGFNAKILFGLKFEAFKKYIQSLKIKIPIADDLAIIIHGEKEQKKNGALLDKMFKLANKLARHTDTRCVLMIDEFPSIMEFKNGSNASLGEDIIRKIRTIYEDQKNIIFVISGSYRSTMETVALSSASPFYRMFTFREIKPLKDKDVQQLLIKAFKGIDEETVKLIIQFSKNIPYYVHLVGRYLKISEKPSKEGVAEAIESILQNDGDLIFRGDLESLTFAERKIAITMACKNLSRPSELAKELNESMNKIAAYISNLEKKGIVGKQSRGIYVFEDPVFSYWLKTKFTENSI